MDVRKWILYHLSAMYHPSLNYPARETAADMLTPAITKLVDRLREIGECNQCRICSKGAKDALAEFEGRGEGEGKS